ncbi:MAG TPA: 4Fe-4S dicluster domain-containing protein [Thermodesulfobacteriota bacterium]|nr:4Fe-4S dicluster domain-containing protein [Thermodesulfobacteriota bacterium]
MQAKKIINRLAELPTMPSTIGTMEWNQTGDWRYLTPVAADKTAPCRRNCPAGIPIPVYLEAVNRGDVQTALALLLAYNPLPGLTGRLCYHPCQTDCTRKKVDGPIPIREIERFLSELSLEEKNNPFEMRDKQVTIIGSGPLGLSCAFFLGCLGLRVTVLEANSRAGGVLLDLSKQKIEAAILENEIKRLIRIAHIRLVTDAVVDLKGYGNLPKSDLTLLDPTGGLEASVPAGEGGIFDPFADEEIPGYLIAVTLPENLKNFKASLIAHYIAAGRQTAEKVFGHLVGSPEQGKGEPGPEIFLKGEALESPQNADPSTARSPVGKGTEAEGAERRKGILFEASRCLYCGTCDLCQQCISSCPEACVRMNTHKSGVSVDLDFCKGCGLCAYECPRGVITMEEAES